MDVNGSLRHEVEAMEPESYLGVDVSPGPGVDEICDAERLLERYGSERFDVLISTELLEHVRDWRRVVSNFKRLLRPEGVLLITTRSRGFHYHGYPFDFWRYEVEDMQAIFSDLSLEALERDPISPGIFLKARKPPHFIENRLGGMSLYSIVLGKRVLSLSDQDVRRFQTRYRVREWLREVLPSRLRRMMPKEIT